MIDFQAMALERSHGLHLGNLTEAVLLERGIKGSKDGQQGLDRRSTLGGFRGVVGWLTISGTPGMVCPVG